MSNPIHVSVITPIYNHASKFVRQCLDSLSAQTLREIEFILVDNGATAEGKQLIEEYVHKDKRFRAIYFEKNQGLGKALNAAIRVAKGEYVGMVESDDYVSEDMFASLYQDTLAEKPDIVKALYTSVHDEQREVLENNFDYTEWGKTLQGQGKCFHLIAKHVSHWSGIYKKAFLEKHGIWFHETPGGASQDFGFMLRCYAWAETVHIHPKSLVHYRIFTGNHNPMKLHRDMIEECILTFQDLKDKQLPPIVWERLFHRIAPRLLYVPPLPQDLYWKRYHLLKEMAPYQKYQFLLPHEKASIKRLIKHPFKTWLKQYVWDRARCVQTKGVVQKSRFLGFTYCRQEPCNGLIQVSYLKGLWVKYLRQQEIEKICVLGIPVYYNRLAALQLQVAQLSQQTQCCLQGINAAIQAQSVHPDVFSKYCNAMAGKEVVLMCTGPTAKYYEPIPKAIHVGVNGAVYLDVPLDFIFVQDNTINQFGNTTLTEDVLSYDKHPCHKFMAVWSSAIRTQHFYEYHTGRKTLFPIPSYYQNRSDISPYILAGAGRIEDMPYDISREPIANLWGTAFSAMQFILYTHPKTIYLVGCDCSSGYAYKTQQTNYLDVMEQTNSWRILKDYISFYYPQQRVVSINPVGLKGLFEDYLTDSYTQSLQTSEKN